MRLLGIHNITVPPGNPPGLWFRKFRSRDTSGANQARFAPPANETSPNGLAQKRFQLTSLLPNAASQPFNYNLTILLRTFYQPPLLSLAQSIKGSKLYLRWRGLHLIPAVPDSPHRPSKRTRSSSLKEQPTKAIPPSIMVGLEALPVESLRSIFGYLQPEPTSHDKSDLFHCTQVCKRWNNIALPLLYSQSWIRLSSPPSRDDFVRRYFTAPHLPLVQKLTLVIWTNKQYTTQRECNEMKQYIQNVISLVSQAESLRWVYLDLSAFTPADCTANIWPSLRPLNDMLTALVRAVVLKGPQIHLQLGRPYTMWERQVAVTSRPVFEGIIREAGGNVHSLSVGCRLQWLLPWLRENPQLRQLYYTKLVSEGNEVEEFWDDLEGRQLEILMLDGFDFPSIKRFPVELVELILTHFDDTVTATNAILANLPHLRLLSLRLQRNLAQIEDEVEKCEEGGNIVSRELRTAWWTLSTAPEGVVPVVVQNCPRLEELSPPRNVTDQDLITMSQVPTRLSEIWMMDCPKITKVGFDALKCLRYLRNLQIQIRFASFLAQGSLESFLAQSTALTKLTIVFDGAKSEAIRRAEILKTLTGSDEFHKRLSQAMSYKPSNLGDKIIIDIKEIR
jgi:hypothetical protein